jgi:hypothetical protein
MAILKMNFNFKKSNPTQAARKRQEEISSTKNYFEVDGAVPQPTCKRSPSHYFKII